MNPLPPRAPQLPTMMALAECPQLASLALLQTALRVVSTSLDLYHPDLGSIQDVVRDSGARPPSLLAQLVVGRCHELADLVAAYRIALHPPPEDFVDDDDSLF